MAVNPKSLKVAINTFFNVIMQINHVTSARILFSSIAWLCDGIYCFLVLFQEIDGMCY